MGIRRFRPLLLALVACLSAGADVCRLEIAGSGEAERTAVAVVGAGPAGLALGYQLRRRQVPFIIVEKESSAGASWARMPAGLRLLSPWRSNRLPGGPVPSFDEYAQISAADFAAYLRSYAAFHSFPLRLDTEVGAIFRGAGGPFRIVTDRDTLEAPMVVSATGYFSAPFRPRYSGAAETSIRQWHFAEYRSPEWLRAELGGDAPKVLVVGGRLSAGQLVVELFDAGIAVTLSHRERVRFGPALEGDGRSVARLIDWEVFEGLWRRLSGSSGPRMDGGRARALLQGGRVPVRPGLARFDGSDVVFEDGRRERFDAVLYATGFRPALGPLASLVTLDERTGRPPVAGLESAEIPGLYFLGLETANVARSRFVRGIVDNAERLADIIAERWRRTAANP